MCELESFPDDENGDVLRRLQASGDDLSKPRDIDFSVIFPDEPSARRFAQLFDGGSVNVKVEKSDADADRPWDVTVTPHMIPSHAGITQFEIELERVASQFGGLNDGWGCFEAKL